MALFPTKKITALSPVVLPLTGFEEFECVQLGNSRKATSRAFVLPTDSLLTMSAMGGSLPGSRRLVSSATVQVNDGGPAGDVTLDVLLTGALPGNPTSLVGLAAINGVANTWMRSDAAPALDQGIVPTWTGEHIFAVPPLSQGTGPRYDLLESDAAVDNRRWQFAVNGEQLRLRLVNDALAITTNFMTVDRTGTVVDVVNLLGTSVQANGSAILTAATAFANPTASIGLAVVNGVATTAMRSDAAPALSQAIAPTWTGTHVFGNAATGFRVENTTPAYRMRDTDAGVDGKEWLFDINAGNFRITTRTDAGGVGEAPLQITRTGVTVDLISLISTSLTWNGAAISTAVGANPTASVGLAAVNGAATSFMRSDAAPALSQAIVPSWTGTHTFSKSFVAAAPAIVMSSAAPGLEWNETDAAADNQRWLIIPTGEQLQFSARNDADSAGNNWLTVDRTGTTIDAVTFPPEVNFTNPNTVGGSYAIEMRSTEPALLFNETGVAADNGQWDIGASGETLRFRAINDAYAAATNWLTVERTGTTIDTVNFPNGTLQYGGLEVGFRGAPQISQSANYTLLITDSGKDILHPNGAGAGDTFTIPANSSVAFPIGTMISFTNMDANNLSIAITTDTLRVAGSTSTGTRTLAQYGVATIKKVEATVWIIYGVGLT